VGIVALIVIVVAVLARLYNQNRRSLVVSSGGAALEHELQDQYHDA
jgi:hypothetical protein